MKEADFYWLKLCFSGKIVLDFRIALRVSEMEIQKSWRWIKALGWMNECLTHAKKTTRQKNEGEENK